VSESTHDASLHDDGFHEIQLSGKQLVFLFMAGTVLVVLIFLCGVQVGRNVKGDRLVSAEPADTMASAAAPAAASTPTEAAPSSGPPAAEPPAPAQEPDDELSYAKRLQAADPSAGDKVAAAPASTPKVETRPVPEQKPAQKPAAESKPAPAQALRPAPTAEPIGTSRPGPWIVQLAAIQDRAEAGNIARRLSGKGYPAFVLDPAAGAPVIYRVQVGGFPDRDAAEQAAKRLEKEEHFKPYVRSR
jgi:cell division septation protein DedD